MKPHKNSTLKTGIKPKKISVPKKISLALSLVAGGAVVVAVLTMPAIPELISDEQYDGQNEIFTFDESPQKLIVPRTKIEEEHGGMGKRDFSKAERFNKDTHYGIKGPLKAPRKSAQGRLRISGTGRGGGGTGKSVIGVGSLNTIGHGGGGGSGYGRGAGGLGGRRWRSARVMRQNSVPFNTERYGHTVENEFLKVIDSPLSTFSIDVDTASYANMRRFLQSAQLPPKDAIRIEEMINYFSYDYREPAQEQPFSTSVETARCPWNKKNLVTRIGLRAKAPAAKKRGVANLVFLIDVSGSMWSPDKLPLLKRSMKMLVNQLQSDDRVAIVVYAGASGLVLQSTPVRKRATILDAIGNLEAGGSTNGGAGIQLAYHVAKRHFVKDGFNRVILATDGDFNVGTTSHGELVRLIENKRKYGVFLSVLGFGTGNYKDSTLEQLADKGNGNYAYIDTVREAQKVLVNQLGQTLVTVAKDVKIQIEFNPQKIASYRLIGYENRILAARDFNDDKKDAGEIGAGHTVTAMYELVPKADAEDRFLTTDKLRYQTERASTETADSNELYTLKLRYKTPQGAHSAKLEHRVLDTPVELDAATLDFKFAVSVAGTGMLLRGSKWVNGATLNEMQKLAIAGKGKDPNGYRNEFVNLISTAQKLMSHTELVSR